MFERTLPYQKELKLENKEKLENLEFLPCPPPNAKLNDP